MKGDMRFSHYNNMKKFLILIVAINSFSLTLNETLNQTNNLEISKKVEEEKSKYNNKYIKTVLETYNRYNFRTEYNISNGIDNSLGQNFNIVAGIGDFTYSFKYDITKNKTLNTIEFSKTLNPLFTNRYKKVKDEHEYNVYKLNEEKNTAINNISQMYIDTYFQQEKIKYLEKVAEFNTYLYKKADVKNKLKTISKNDYEKIKDDYEIQNLNLEKEKLNLLKMKQRLKMQGINFDLNEDLEKPDIALDIDLDKILSKKESEKDIKLLEKTIQEENYQEYFYNNVIPNIYVNARYTFEDKSYGFGVGVNLQGEIIDFQRDEMFKQKNELEEKYKENISKIDEEKEMLKIQYEALLLDKKIMEKELQSLEKEYENNIKKYELGVISEVEFMTKNEEYIKSVSRYLDFDKSFYSFLLENAN